MGQRKGNLLLESILAGVLMTTAVAGYVSYKKNQNIIYSVAEVSSTGIPILGGLAYALRHGEIKSVQNTDYD